MIFELMSNGKLAELPPGANGAPLLNEPSVTLLLPHNRYLSGRCSDGKESWEWGRLGAELQPVYLYEGERLCLPQDGVPPVVLSEETVSLLRRELLSQMEPPGEHQGTVLLLRSLMKDHPAFAEGFPFLDEHAFALQMNNDSTLRGAYWALRFAATRGEFDEMVRLRSWLKVARLLELPDSEPGVKLWFSILDIPDEAVIHEIEELEFSIEDLRHMAAQRVSPLLMFNPHSGYLILARFGRNGSDSNFFVWAFLPTALWGELRERRKISVHEILLAIWGQHDVENALEERRLYSTPDGGPAASVRQEPSQVFRA